MVAAVKQQKDNFKSSEMTEIKQNHLTAKFSDFSVQREIPGRNLHVATSRLKYVDQGPEMYIVKTEMKWYNTWVLSVSNVSIQAYETIL